MCRPLLSYTVTTDCWTSIQYTPHTSGCDSMDKLMDSYLTNCQWSLVDMPDGDNIIIILITPTLIFMVLSSWPKPLREFTRFIWWMQNADPRIKPVDLGCESTGKWLLPSTSTIPIVIITHRKSWCSFYHPTEGGRLSRPRHCRKGAQPVPKAVHRSGCRDKHNWPRPLTPQPIMLDHCDLLRHVGVNNLPKVVTSQLGGQESDSRKNEWWILCSNHQTTEPPCVVYIWVYVTCIMLR